MNYEQARQQQNEDGTPGKWHWTNRNDGRIYPVGNCAHDCPGHDTADAAAEHQRQYDLTELRLDQEYGSWSECEVCGKLTKMGAEIPYRGWSLMLCDEHRTREIAEPKYVLTGGTQLIHS